MSKLKFNVGDILRVVPKSPYLELVEAAPQKPSWGPEYQALIDDLREMHEEDAAEYLENEAWQLPHWRDTGGLTRCFTWGDSPQGPGYWRNLRGLLQEYRSKRQERVALRDAAADDLEKMGEVEAAENLRALSIGMDYKVELLESMPLNFFCWGATPQGGFYWADIDALLLDYRSKPKPHERTKEEALKGIRKGTRVKVMSCEPLDEAGGSVGPHSRCKARLLMGSTQVVQEVDSEGDVWVSGGVLDPRHLEALPYEPREGDVVDHPEHGRGVVFKQSVHGATPFRIDYEREVHAYPSDAEKLVPTGYNIFDLGD